MTQCSLNHLGEYRRHTTCVAPVRDVPLNSASVIFPAVFFTFVKATDGITQVGEQHRLSLPALWGGGAT